MTAIEILTAASGQYKSLLPEGYKSWLNDWENIRSDVDHNFETFNENMKIVLTTLLRIMPQGENKNMEKQISYP